jgi:hypothetical protein
MSDETEAPKVEHTEREVCLKMRVFPDAMFLREGIGTAEGTLPDGRPFKGEMALNVGTSHPLIGIKVEEEERTVFYVIDWTEMMDAAVKLHVELFPKADAEG